MSDLYVVLTGILEDSFGIPRTEVGPTTRLSDLDMESLARAELSLILQDRLGFPMADVDVPGEATLADVVGLLRSLRAEASPAPAEEAR
ncbi:acyl carrier protein [Streptomyces sp. NPDC021100]|uniref:acyl carrier protein n=1 Tax=Streptomyces sp. NPDC021100 TaxID=3365114 RepID=UPI0037A19181